MFFRYLKLFIVMFFTLLLLSCTSEKAPSVNSSTATVSISLAATMKKAGLAQQQSATSLPADITRIVIICSGNSMQTVKADLPLDGRPLLLEIPAGVDRLFTAEAYAGELLRMSGHSLLNYLYAGSETIVNISLLDLAEISLLPTADAQSIILELGATQKFSASVTSHIDNRVRWTVNGIAGGNSDVGMIDDSGLYTAPLTITDGTTVSIRATSVEDSSLYAQVSVSFVAASSVSVSIDPVSVVVSAGASQTFTALVTGGNDIAVSWTVENSTCSVAGMITADGVYTASESLNCSETVKVTSVADNSRSAIAQVSVTSHVSMSVSPTSVSLPVGGGSQVFTVQIGGTTNTAVSWYVNDIAGGDTSVGTIAADGTYTAPAILPASTHITIRGVSDADPQISVQPQVSLLASCLPGSLSVNSVVDAVDANIGDGVCDDGSGNCTLRAAVQETNACAGADSIVLPAGNYVLSIAGISEDAAASGDLDILYDLHITGAGARDSIVDGNSIDRVFHQPDGSAAQLQLSTLSIKNGVATTDAGGGGILCVGGSLRINEVSLDNNRATSSTGSGNGGGIYTRSCNLNISDSTISNNAAQGAGYAVGGGILATGGGNVQISNSTLSGNSAINYGGGIQINGGGTTLTNTTVVNNTAPVGAGINVRYFANGAMVNLHNTIVSNPGSSNCASDNGSNPFPFSAAADSLDVDGTCSNATTVADVRMGNLANNGGPTQSHILLSGSPAINTGDNSVCPVNDQRGVARSDGQCDIGAVEGSLSTYTCLGSTIQVNSTLDAVDANIGDGVCDEGSGACTLRAAIQESNACIGADIIMIPAATHTLNIANTGATTAATGDLYITDDLTMIGVDVATAIIDGNRSVVNDSVFNVAANTAVSISALTIQNGGGAQGGGIYNRGNLSLDNVLITGNRVNQVGSSWGTGGGIYSSGDLLINNSTISNNYSTTSGSGIHNVGTASVRNCTVTGNTRGSGYWGAGITNSGSMSVESSSFSNNADYGFRNDNSGTAMVNASIFNGDNGGIVNNANLTVTNTTISNSTSRGGIVNEGGTLNLLASTLVANKGGGVNNSNAMATITNTTISGTIPNQCNAGIHDDRGTVTVINSTITDTQIDPDDSWWCSTYGVSDTNWGGSISLINTIVFNNGDGDCIAGAAIRSDAFSLVSDGSCGASSSTDPLLLPLADNGGPTQTHALQTGSPAIDAADNTNCPATDQRGIKRSDGACDVGAYEY